MSFILDAFVTLLWLAPDTNSAGEAIADATLKALKVSQALVPSLWSLEVGNVIAKLEAKNIVTEADSQRFIALLGQLDIVTDAMTASRALGDTLNLARRYKLSVYDAAYLELALRTGRPMATLDADLTEAANLAGIPIFGQTAKPIQAI
ncbi:MAG: type II toxin-antitoxin system VapC family toxin [Azoarcus sp.]|jgi:predicted nucleic acid-binding protein|nr:type II toxin-antitoxin system VapC family toxin [Azoarcus sp.]